MFLFDNKVKTFLQRLSSTRFPFDNKAKTFDESNRIDDKVKTFFQFNRIDEKVTEFYTIRIPSLAIEHYTAPTTTSSSSVNHLPKNGSVYQLSLSANTYILPSRLKGRIPSPTTHEVVEQEKEWISLMKQSHGFGTTRARSLISTVS